MNPEKIKRIVLKLGTNSVIKDNRFNSSLVNAMAAEISEMVRGGRQFIIVSSGAIGLGLEKTRLHNQPRPVEMQQALAAIGQSQLMNNYEKAFGKYNQMIAQVLLSQENFERKESLCNLKNALEKLLSLNVVPIINENDAVAVEELAFKKHFSDNDGLAVTVASHLNADLLVMVSSVGGLFTANPEQSAGAKLIEKVSDIGEVSAAISGKSSAGRGGFATKMRAAEIALNNRIPLIVTKGKNGFLGKIMKGEIEGTLFEK
ncbi:MAG: glutamate 5-kinase [Candidatus Diapherotrites archaeon]|nr:glutamate 5-kinase [Candidatus Diapherotrites archaeon]